MVLINGVSARFGGAREILHSATMAARERGSVNYVIICPAPDKLPQAENIRYITLSLNGIFAFIFNILAIGFFAWLLRARTIISLNNVNFIFPFFSRITYFHQYKIISGTGIRFRLMRSAIKLGGRQEYIVQSPFVRDSFLRLFGENNEVRVRWPGVAALEKMTSPCEEFLLWVVTDVMAPQKNFPLALEVGKLLAGNHSQAMDGVLATSNRPENIGETTGIKFVGRQDRSGLANLYARAAGLLVTSTEETLGLPIFEFLQTGKPIYIAKAPYVESVFYGFSSMPKNVVIFDSAADLLTKFQPGRLEIENSLENWMLGKDCFYSGQWDFLDESGSSIKN